MRRNSENLLLLAGHETTRKWSAPVPLADVVRAATSEIEQYSRVAMKIQPGISLTGPAVSDVVHLLAEIVENATIFSSKDTPVHISGQQIPSGGVLIEVKDSGVGIPEARLAEMNLRLDNPPVIEVSVSRHMGLFAVARLAERHGVRVRLRARSPRGLTALVWLPDDVAERGAARSGWPGSRPMPAAPAMPAVPTMPPMPAGAAGAAQPPATARESAQAADSAASDWFRSSRSLAPGSGGSPSAAPPEGGGWRAGADEWAEGNHAAQIVADPVRGDHTAAGLPVRVPRANLIPGSAGGHRAGSGATSRPPDGRPADGRGAQAASAARAPRSPELARSRLSGFQRGTRRAKGQTPHAGEGADR
jgi:hypothetical protein